MLKKTNYYINSFLDTKKHLRSYEIIKQRTTYFSIVFGDKRVFVISNRAIKKWIEALQKTGKYKSSTIKRFITTAKQILDLAAEDGEIKENPIKNIFLPKDEIININPFTKDEVNILMKNATGWFKSYIVIGFNTGLRTGEIFGLQWEDIDYKNLIISVNRNVSCGKITPCKTVQSIRKVPFSKSLLEYFLELENNSEWLFANKNNSHFFGSSSCKAKWKNLLNKCKIKYRRLYEMRHTFASHMVNKSSQGNFSLMDISKILGHKDLHTTLKIYAKAIENNHLKINREFSLY